LAAPPEEKEEREERSELSWEEELSQNLDYYLDTPEGREELARRAAERARKMLQEVMRSTKGRREIIWLSPHCLNCRQFTQPTTITMRCEKYGVRLVKPFYGVPIWTVRLGPSGMAESVVADIDWQAKRRAVSDYLVERAMKMINHGRPYPCYEGP
jgi:hypothetical protein